MKQNDVFALQPWIGSYFDSYPTMDLGKGRGMTRITLNWKMFPFDPNTSKSFNRLPLVWFFFPHEKRASLVNPFTTKTLLVILHTIPVMSFWRILALDQLVIPCMINIFLHCHHLSAWYFFDIVGRNSVLITHGFKGLKQVSHAMFHSIILNSLRG